MDRYSIEKRDRELVERFRAKVELKEQQKRRNRMRLMAAVLVLVSAGIIFYYKSSPTPDLSPDRHGQTDGQMAGQMHRSTAVAVSRGPSKAPPTPEVASPAGAIPSEPFAMSEFSEEAVQETEMAPAEKAASVEASVEALTEAPDATLRKVPEESEATDQPMPAEKSVVAERTTPAELPVLEPRDSLSGKDGLSQKPAPLKPEGSIRIAGITVAQNVRNKQPVNRKTEFSIKQGAKPYVWMDVRSETPPFELRHVYYLKDQRYCVVPLDIRYTRMRTWSTISLEYPTQIGHWRVDVVTKKGEVLSQVEFVVVP